MRKAHLLRKSIKEASKGGKSNGEALDSILPRLARGKDLYQEIAGKTVKIQGKVCSIPMNPKRLAIWTQAVNPKRTL